MVRLERREATRESKGPGGAREARRERESEQKRGKSKSSRNASSLSPIRALFDSSPTLRVGRRHGADRAKAILRIEERCGGRKRGEQKGEVRLEDFVTVEQGGGERTEERGKNSTSSSPLPSASLSPSSSLFSRFFPVCFYCMLRRSDRSFSERFRPFH